MGKSNLCCLSSCYKSSTYAAHEGQIKASSQATQLSMLSPSLTSNTCSSSAYWTQLSVLQVLFLLLCPWLSFFVLFLLSLPLFFPFPFLFPLFLPLVRQLLSSELRDAAKRRKENELSQAIGVRTLKVLHFKFQGRPTSYLPSFSLK